MGNPMSSRPAEVPARASVQETTLDLLWIADGVACFAGVGHTRLYRGVLAAAAPPEAFAGSEHIERALAGYTALLNSLRHPLEVQVRTHATDVDAYVERWETRSRLLPPALAALAREHADWARRHLPELGLVERRLYLVIPADESQPPYRSLLSLGRTLRQHLPRRGAGPTNGTEQSACTLLADRCERLQLLLNRASIRSWRLDDQSLARLYRDGWGHRQSGQQRFDRDLGAFFAQPRQVA
jgi:hypothetical protein